MPQKYVSRVIPQKNCRSRTVGPVPLGIVIVAKIGSYSGRNSRDESRQFKPKSRCYEIRSGLFVEGAELRRVGRFKAHRWRQQWRPHSRVAGSQLCRWIPEGFRGFGRVQVALTDPFPPCAPVDGLFWNWARMRPLPYPGVVGRLYGQ